MKMKVVKSIFLSVLITSLTAGIPTGYVSAQETAVQQGADPSADIWYVGTNEDYFKFEVNLRQAANQKLVLRVLDENGVVLYRETVNAREFNKLIKVTRNDYSRLSFIVSGSGTSFTKSFSINVEVSENYLVNEISSL
jgi:hypothetical protein